MLLQMKQQIYDDLVEYFSSSSPHSSTALAAPPSSPTCKALLTTGIKKGSRCLNKAKDNTLFCGVHKGAATAGNGSLLQKPQHCRAIVINNTIHRKQCKHIAKQGSSFCGIHKTHYSDGANAAPKAFESLHNRNESMRKLREAQPNLNRQRGGDNQTYTC